MKNNQIKCVVTYLPWKKSNTSTKNSSVVNPAVNGCREMKLVTDTHFMLRAVNRLVCAQGKEITRLVEVMK